VVTITKLTYNARKAEITLEATSSLQPNVRLFAYDNRNPSSPVLLGELAYNRGRRVYTAKFTGVAPNPTEFLVVSTGGGSATQTLQ
jgi:hypothetical protein